MMERQTNDGNIVLWSLELPESDIDGDTTFTLSLQFVQNPSVLERTLSELSSFLLELLDGTLVDSTALVDQVLNKRVSKGSTMVLWCLHQCLTKSGVIPKPPDKQDEKHHQTSERMGQTYTSGGGLARIDVADDDDVNVSLFLSHFDCFVCVKVGLLG